VCAYKEQYPGASQQNIANSVSLLWGKPTSWCCVVDILRNKKQFKFATTPALTPILEVDEVCSWNMV
jgi:hypothetical protein